MIRVFHVFVKGGAMVGVATSRPNSELFEVIAKVERQTGLPVTHMVEMPCKRPD